MKANDLFDAFSCKTDTKARRVLNVAPDKSANITAEQLESGVSLEALDAIGVPVFRYQTQITIHGKIADFNPNAKPGGYKAVFKNGNGSVGVKYSAIDGEKKKLVRQACHLSGEWSPQMSSEGLTLTRTFGPNDKEAAISFAMAAKPLAELVYGSLYGMALPWGSGFMICLYIGAIPAENLWPFITKATGINSQAEIDALQAVKDAESKAKREAWEKECEARALEHEQEKKRLMDSLSAFRLAEEPKTPGSRFRLLNSLRQVVTIELSGTVNRMFYTIDGGKRHEYKKGWPIAASEGRIFACES